jgi:ribosomal protein S18 acetylase RimI-like enzyme
MNPARERPPFRPATPDDDDVLARFIDMAGEGLPRYLWREMADPGESPWTIGRERARRETGGFSYRNATFRMAEGEPAACLIGYPLDVLPAPMAPGTPAMFLPLEELESMVPGTWYINAVATREDYRGRGYGKELMALAESMASNQALHGPSLIVADTNTAARQFYRHLGYRELARRTMHKARWRHPGNEWVLMVKDR